MNDLAIDSDAGRRVQQVGHLSDGTALDYAWGIRVVETPYGRQISHGGMWANRLAKTVRFPEKGVAVAVLSIGGTEDEISRLGVELATRLATE